MMITQSGVWNVGTGVACSFQKIAEKIAEQEGAKIEMISMPDDMKGQYQAQTCADLTKLNQLIHKKWLSVEEYLEDPSNYRMAPPTLPTQTTSSQL